MKKFCVTRQPKHPAGGDEAALDTAQIARRADYFA
jgi:hypothetical protein